jgi:hypothetical protein
MLNRGCLNENEKAEKKSGILATALLCGIDTEAKVTKKEGNTEIWED